MKTCLNCKKEYIPNTKSQLFCSRSCSKTGKFNPYWKGDKVGYSGLHEWIRKRLIKPNSCQFCGKNKPLDLANISQKYKRELTDWIWLCKKCHFYQDERDKKTRATQFKKGNSGPWLGKHRSEETKKKISKTLKRLGIKPIKPYRGGRSHLNKIML